MPSSQRERLALLEALEQIPLKVGTLQASFKPTDSLLTQPNADWIPKKHCKCVSAGILPAAAAEGACLTPKELAGKLDLRPFMRHTYSSIIHLVAFYSADPAEGGLGSCSVVSHPRRAGGGANFARFAC